MKYSLRHLAIILLSSLLTATVFGQSATAQADETKIDPDLELRRAIERSGGSETQIIVNLEEYLRTFPRSIRRTEIETEIYKLSLKLRDRERTITYGEKIIEADQDNIEVLMNLVSTLRERRAEGDLNKSIGYADMLVKQFEGIIASSLKPRRVSAAQWEERKRKGLASVYLLRGKVHFDLNNFEQSRADLKKSFEAGRLAGAAISLGELAEKRRNPDEAFEYYRQAFVIALNTDEEVDLPALRKKLGLIYRARHGSETGLGDQILKAYDRYIRETEERAAKLHPPNPNAGITDPLSFKLSRPDGPELDLETLRGKTIVMNFWATWCGPCLTELPLFAKTIEKFRDDKDVVFLAITTDEDRNLVTPFLKRHKFNLPVVFADGLNDFFNVTSIPTTLIIDPGGRISYRQAGYNPREDFVEKLSERIEESRK
ncbi:MAG: redoxin family protein [Acidobacteriota bacterium]|nr:MAG: redoxin family protein [Acidobacteriota bacterium]